MSKKRRLKKLKAKLKAKLKGEGYVGDEVLKRDISQQAKIDSLKKQIQQKLEENAKKDIEIDSLKQVIKVPLKK